jgi:NAD(P)-dependent dehydrogenase (short-subunit alcohol dehydrogenase family)
MEDANGWGFGVAYCVSKASVNMLTKMTANKLSKENFVVFASHPGWVKTSMGGEDAPVTPEESIRGQLANLDKFGKEENGGFYDFEGNALSW